jgi:hypothetical protein
VPTEEDTVKEEVVHLRTIEEGSILTITERKKIPDTRCDKGPSFLAKERHRSSKKGRWKTAIEFGKGVESNSGLQKTLCEEEKKDRQQHAKSLLIYLPSCLILRVLSFPSYDSFPSRPP